MLLLATAMAAIGCAIAATAVVRGDDDAEQQQPSSATLLAVFDAYQEGSSVLSALASGTAEDGIAGELAVGLLSMYAGQARGAGDVLAELNDALSVGEAGAAGDADDGVQQRRATHHNVARSVMAFHEANGAVPRGAASAYANASAELMASGASRKRALVPGLIDDIADGPLANLLRTITGQERQALTKRRSLLRKAAPLECIDGGGVRKSSEDGTCPVDSLPKRSGSYVWAVAQSRRNVFYGTLNDVLCNFGLGDQCPQREQDRIFMQRFDDGCCKPDGPPLDITPDETDTALSAIECVTRKSLSTAKWANGAERFCLGFATRFALPLDFEPRAILFDGDTGALLESKKIDELVSVRTAVVHDGRMFFGGAQPGEAAGGVLEWLPSKHSPLSFKLVGDLTGVSGTVSSLTVHEGRLFASTWSSMNTLLSPILAAFIANDVATADALLARVKPGSIVSSPALKRVRRKTNADWVKHTDTCAYDPNPFMCRLTSYHDINTHRNELYFGTQNLILTDIVAVTSLCPIFSSGAPLTVCNPASADPWVSQSDGTRTACDFCTDAEANVVGGILSSLRATSLFRASNLARGPSRSLELLYGYYAFIDSDFSLDAPVPNVDGSAQLPQHGLAGFNNLFNGYTWQVESFDNKLWVATWDFVGILNDLLNDLVNGLLPFAVKLELGTPGADLYSMQRTRLSLNAETLDGFGNELNYGIFKLEPLKCFTAANGDTDAPNSDFDLNNDDDDFTDDDDNDPKAVPVDTDDNVDDDNVYAMLVGTANPFATEAEGGWELHCLVDEANV